MAFYIVLLILSLAGVALLFEIILIRDKTYHSFAMVAHTMPGLVKRYLTEGSTAKIVGTDCPGLFKWWYPWRRTLRNWVESRSLEVRYVLVNPNTETIERMRAIASRLGDQFECRVIRDREFDDADLHTLVSDIETHHFAVFHEPKQLWIEGEHPRNRIYATNCEYLNPDRAESDSRFECYDRDFDLLWEHAESLNPA